MIRTGIVKVLHLQIFCWINWPQGESAAHRVLTIENLKARLSLLTWTVMVNLEADRYPKRRDLKEETRMITVANRLYVKPEYADAFEKVFRERAGLVDKMPGFISNQILRPVNDGDPYVVFTTWESRSDFMNWIRSDEFVKGHAQSGTLPKDAYARTNVLELHEVLQDSSRPELPPEPHGGPFNMH